MRLRLILALLLLISCGSTGKKQVLQDVGPDVFAPDLRGVDNGWTSEVQDVQVAEALVDAGANPEGGSGDSGESDGDAAPVCPPTAPFEPFELGLTVPGSSDPFSPGEVDSMAIVTYAGPGTTDYDWTWELRFQLEGGGEVTALLKLHNALVPPLVAGESVLVRTVQESPWWVNSYLAVWDSGNELRLFVYQGTGDGQPEVCKSGVCPTVSVGKTDCPAQPGECGDVVHPPAMYDGFAAESPVVPQGTRLTLAGEKLHFWTITVRRNVTMECVDYPDTWLAALVMDSSDVSQCECSYHHECADSDVCETEAGRCVPDLCWQVDCPDGQWCDPYKSDQCFGPPPGPLYSCDTNADCPAGGMCESVCNTMTGFCEESMCCVADCMGSCSALMQACYNCLSDCDCLYGQQCNTNTHQCASCNMDKLKLTQDNPQMFEFYELCAPADMAGLAQQVQAIDPSLYCGVVGGFAGCKTGVETGCHGDLSYQPGTKQLTDIKWQQLCQLSMLPFVSTIGGGHFVD